MDGHAEFIAYCLEEYKFAKGITGKEVIALFKEYDIIDYVVSCYGALHTMGGLAITEDIDGLIEDMKQPARFNAIANSDTIQNLGTGNHKKNRKENI